MFGLISRPFFAAKLASKSPVPTAICDLIFFSDVGQFGVTLIEHEQIQRVSAQFWRDIKLALIRLKKKTAV